MRNVNSFKNALLIFVDPAKHFTPEGASARGLVQFGKSMMAHYRGNGLSVYVVDGSETSDSNFVYDAAIGEIPLITVNVKELADEFGTKTLPSVALISETGKPVWHHSGAPRAYTIAIAIESLLGEPAYRKYRYDMAKKVSFRSPQSLEAVHEEKYDQIPHLPYFNHAEPKFDAVNEPPKTVGPGEYYVSTQEEYDRVKTKTFSPGDVVYFARGKVFYGMFEPSGAGTSDKPIKLLSYGRGPRPIIDAKREPGGIVLFNTEGWVIDGINIKGGRCWGIFVGSNIQEHRVYSDFTIRNCSVYDTGFEWPMTKMDGYSGPICFNVYDARTGEMGNVHFSNVLIDNCEAYNTTRGEGIYLGGSGQTTTRSENVTIQNCFVHNCGLDGILVMCGGNVVLRDNVAFHTGMSPVNVGYSPNSIWTWRCTKALVSGNEASFAHSPIHNKDGGAFDIDFYCKENVYEYNYAHDNDTYGISVFGAGYSENMPHPEDHITSSTVVRHNYFGHNQILGWGEVYFLTWNGGLVDGFEFYDNFIYSDPVDKAQPAITFPEVAYVGDLPRVFRDNVIYSSAGFFMDIASTDGVVFDGNHYYSDAKSLKWRWADVDYANLEEYRSKAAQEESGLFTDGCPSATDFAA